MTEITEGTTVWEPGPRYLEESNMVAFSDWLEERHGTEFREYEDLWEWSVAELETFWADIWEYYGFESSYEEVLASPEMPGAQWFPGARLNYTDHIFRQETGDYPAMIADAEWRSRHRIDWRTLRDRVGSVAEYLRQTGVEKGDRVVSYMPHVPETIVAFLATASLGATWSSCSPDFGADSVVDRFSQIDPKVLFTCDGYYYSGETYDRSDVVRQINDGLDSLEQNILLEVTGTHTPGQYAAPSTPWNRVVEAGGSIQPEPVEFDHPLWVLFSSGTTGPPKPIVQGHGGILLEHYKMHGLHHDLSAGDRFYWSTTTGWMMWNYVVSALLRGCTIQLYDGDPGHPDLDTLWKFAAETNMNLFGTSAPYLHACMNRGLSPGEDHDLEDLESVGSTGAPLSPEGFQWVYECVKQDVWLTSVSGGTDVCSAFLAGVPTRPVRAGELQGRALGAAVYSYDEDGNRIRNETGELVIEEPMPSMPIYFWNDPGDERYRESYFQMYPGVWRHGDWVKITDLGSAIIYGRSDSTLNRKGVRFGTSEIYRAVETLPGVEDSLVIGLHQDDPGRESKIVLFVVPAEGRDLDEELRDRLNDRILEALTPRHLPDRIEQIPAVPCTLSGKKMEVPVTGILEGEAPGEAANPDSMSNPETLDWFVDYARENPIS